MKKAFHIANTGRPGPVVVDIPKDVSQAKCPFEYPETVQMRSYNPVVKGHLGPDQEGRAAAARGQAPDDLHRRRRDPGNASEQLRKLVATCWAFRSPTP
jgi:acetolactate synthase-1/2/3 large subunit